MIIFAVSVLVLSLFLSVLTFLYGSAWFHEPSKSRAVKWFAEVCVVFGAVSSLFWAVLLVVPLAPGLAVVTVAIAGITAFRLLKFGRSKRGAFLLATGLASMFCILSNAVFDLIMSDPHSAESDTELIFHGVSHALAPSGLLVLSASVFLATASGVAIGHLYVRASRQESEVGT